MPVHDWSRVPTDVFHHFHQAWLASLGQLLNGGILPSQYYALIEQHAGRTIPDLLTLHEPVPDVPERGDDGNGPPSSVALAGTSTLAVQQPQVELRAELDSDTAARLQRTLTIRHVSGDRVVAFIEMMSRANKTGVGFERFVEKLATALVYGCHVLVVDLHRSSAGAESLQQALWTELGATAELESPQKPFICSAFTGEPSIAAFIQSYSLGEPLPAMPLFLSTEKYVLAPLEEAYGQSYASLPNRWKRVLEE